MNWESIVEEKARRIMQENGDKLLSHDFDHIKRVQKIAIYLADKEGADRETVSIASLLHDIVTKRSNAKGKLLPPGMHAKMCAEKAGEILKEINYPDEKRKRVMKIISQHEWSQDIERDMESQILYEADKIDSAGYFGALRHSYAVGELGIPLVEAIKHHLKAVDEIGKRYKTSTGKKIYENKIRININIFKKALEELNVA